MGPCSSLLKEPHIIRSLHVVQPALYFIIKKYRMISSKLKSLIQKPISEAGGYISSLVPPFIQKVHELVVKDSAAMRPIPREDGTLVS